MPQYKKLPRKRRYYVCEIKDCKKKAMYYDTRLEFSILGFTHETWSKLIELEGILLVCEEHHHG